MPNISPKIGAHVSVSGGLHNAFEHGTRLRCDCIQIFVKNQRQWVNKPLNTAQIRLFKTARDQCGIIPVIAHATYLINLAAPDGPNLEKSIAATIDELTRCEALGIPFLVLHPGAHLGAGYPEGIRRAAQSLDIIHTRTAGFTAKVALENTAGQGSALGHDLAHLGQIIGATREPQRVAVCLDTCHLFVAGYKISDEEHYERTVGEIERFFGTARVCCLHANDSKTPCGSRVDRHAHIGQGLIGCKGFRPILCDPRFARVPRILETPHDKDEKGREWLKLDLAALRKVHTLAGKRPAVKTK